MFFNGLEKELDMFFEKEKKDVTNKIFKMYLKKYKKTQLKLFSLLIDAHCENEFESSECYEKCKQAVTLEEKRVIIENFFEKIFPLKPYLFSRNDEFDPAKNLEKNKKFEKELDMLKETVISDHEALVEFMSKGVHQGE